MMTTMAQQPAQKTAQNGSLTPFVPPKRVHTREYRLEGLRKAYSDDPVFSHLRYQSRLIPGYGSTHPKLVLLVEAPSFDARGDVTAYLQGPEHPFVLDLLRSIDLPMHQVYVTGLVKFPLPKNRAARPDEVAASLSHLAKELDVVQAQTIVVFGRHLVSVVLPGIDLVHDHGVVCGERRRWMPMFHPYSGLLNKDIREALFRDFRRLNVIL